jgi:hypothetical protein
MHVFSETMGSQLLELDFLDVESFLQSCIVHHMLFNDETLELVFPLELPDLKALDLGDLTPDLGPLSYHASGGAQERILTLHLPAFHPLRTHD